MLGVFFSMCMMVVSASVVFTVWVLNLHYRKADTHVMGRLVCETTKTTHYITDKNNSPSLVTVASKNNAS
jgi:hypothetical protein